MDGKRRLTDTSYQNNVQTSPAVLNYKHLNVAKYVQLQKYDIHITFLRCFEYLNILCIMKIHTWHCALV